MSSQADASWGPERQPGAQLIDLTLASKVAAKVAAVGALEGSYLLDDLEANLSALVREAEVLGEVIEGAAWENPQLARSASQHTRRGRDRPIAPGDDNPTRAGFHAMADTCLQLLRLHALDAKAA